MRQDLTDISIVLDRSGSMASVATDTIGGFNTFIEEQRKVPGDANVSLVQFDNIFETIYDAKPIKDAPLLSHSTFIPRGGTALLDAVGRTIIATGKRLSDMTDDARPARVVFVIVTDGEENQSREFTREKVFEQIKHQTEAYKWQFIFIGANQDAIAAGASMGIGAANSLSFAANAVGTRSSYQSLASNVSNYRTGLNATAAFNDADRDAQTAAGVKV